MPRRAEGEWSIRPTATARPWSERGGGFSSTRLGKWRSNSLARLSGWAIAKKATRWPLPRWRPATSSMYASAPPRRWRNLFTCRILMAAPRPGAPG